MPFDNPAILRTLSLLGTMHPLASVPTDYCAGLFGLHYKAVQRWFTDTVITPVFEGWLETNILNGTINLPAAKLDKFNAPDWKPRRWAWVDPLKDQQASILAVVNHLKSKRQVISESGGDIEDVFRDIKKDEELAEDVGLEKPSESEPSVP